jgi:hypothetical protein
VIYLKCALAGLAAVFVIFGILAISATSIVLVIGVLGLGIDIPQWHFRSPVFWVSALVIFGAGFFWQHHRFTK